MFIHLLFSALITTQAPLIHESEKTSKEIASFGGVQIELDHAHFSATQLGDSFELSLPIEPNNSIRLELERFDALTSDFRGHVSTLDEEGKLHQETLIRPDISFFKGRVQGNPDSKAFLAIGQHTTNGLITIGHDTFVVAQKQDTGEKIAYNLSNVNPDRMNWIDISCGVEEYVHTAYATEETSSRGIDEGADCPTLRIAVDTDWDFTALFGGNTDASGEYAATLMGAMSTIYEEDVEVATRMCYLRLWSTSADPWSTSGSGARLDEFVSYWNSNMSGISRHLAHHFSGAGLGGGVAYVSVVCSSGFGYAVSGNLGGSFPLPIEDHNGNNWDLMVVAHETGHNCGTLHTHDYSPPIDGCGLGDCSLAWGGTIMSYCHTCSGGLSNMVMDLHPIVQETIENYLAGVPCSLGGDGSPPIANLDTVYVSDELYLDIDILANDYSNDCLDYVELVSVDEESHLGGTIEVLGDDPSQAIIRYSPTGVTNTVDIFNYIVGDASGQETEGGVFVNIIQPRPADTPSATEPGIKVFYYALEPLSQLPNFDELTPFGDEIVGDVNYPSTGGDFMGSGLSDDIGAVFEGFVEVQETNMYTFYVNSDDGSKLFVGNQLIVDNDGLHGMNEESGAILLAQGLHEVRVEFFERGGGAGCIVSISSDMMAKEVIPSDSYSHEVTECIGDINNDGTVNVTDVLVLIGDWGTSNPETDLDGDGVVAVSDLLILIGNYGNCE